MMDKGVKQKRLFKLTMLFLMVFLISAALFHLIWKLDNKYTAKGPQPIKGVLLLDEETLRQYPVIWLVRDWEIYRDRLLTPEDFKEMAPSPDELVFIGQYSGFEGSIGPDMIARSPHGSATYRLNIRLPKETRSYTLELPEIYSAYRIYINGIEMKKIGDPDPHNYIAKTQTSSLTVQGNEQMEIIVAVTDYSHFYSGMVYPPAFGEPSAVNQIINQRITMRTFAISIALFNGFISLILGFFNSFRWRQNERKALPFLYSTLCLCFTLYICYPVVKTLFPSGLLIYRVETFAYCFILLLIIFIQDQVTSIKPLWTKVFTSFGIFVCTWSIIVPFIMGDSLNLMITYSKLISLYTWICAVYLTISTAILIYQGVIHDKMMFIGMTVFDAALVADRLFPLYEPIGFGWFTEIAGGLVVILIGITMVLDIIRQLRLQQAVNARAESASKMLDIQRAYHPVLLEKEKEIREARHDLHHHISIIQELVTNANLDKLRDYLNIYHNKLTNPIQTSYCNHYVTDMLLRMYVGLAKNQDTEFIVEAKLPPHMDIDDVDLCIILSNLLENALEASLGIPPQERQVIVHIGQKHNRFIILVENYFDGNIQKSKHHFLSKKQENRIGVGISSIETTADYYGGDTNFYVKGKLFCSEVFIPNRLKEKNEGN